MPVTKDIIFMIGCPRSGTTLLNRLLRDEMRIGFANELQLIPKFYPKIGRYGDLAKDTNFDKLIHDILKEPYSRIFQKTYSGMMKKQIKITYDDIVKNVNERSFAGVVYALLKVTSDQLDCEYVGNKHLSMGLHLDWLYDMFPNARLIHLVRDGRDCAMSLKHQWWGQKNTYTAAVLWKKHINRINTYAKNLGSDKIIEIRYEDFLSDPGKEMSRLHKFIRNREPDKEKKQKYDAIKHVINANNAYKWKNEMNNEDAAIFQAVAGSELSLHNYETCPSEKTVSFLEKIYYILTDRISREYNYRFTKKR